MIKTISRLAPGLSCLAIVATLVACGGSEGSGGGADPSSSSSYTVAVTVTTAVANGESFVFGLGTQSATVSAQNAAVGFSQAVAGGSSFSVTQISGPRHCTLTNASGTLSANTSVSADCSWPNATVTAVGSPVSGTSPATQSMGAAGGSVTSSDGLLTLTVPANALSATTTLSIQPVSNNAPGGLGNAYRLQPEGQTFAKPVTLTMAYTDSDIAGGNAQTLGIATQAADGTWSATTASVDTTAKTVSVSSTHFSDWSKVQELNLRPPSATVKVGKSTALEIAYCVAPPPDSPNVALGYNCDQADVFPLMLTVTNCSVNGVVGGNSALGKVSYSSFTATYTAPSTVPSPATVAVSCDVTESGSKTKYTLISNITVVGQSYSGTFSADVNWDLQDSSVATTVLSGFVLDAANSVAGDVTRYINGVGTAKVTVTPLGCSSAVQDIPFSAALLVWDPKSPSAGGVMASRYALQVVQTDFPLITVDCGGTPVTTTPSAIALAMDCANSMPNTLGITVSSTQPYTDPTKLSGSVDLTCVESAGGGISTTFTSHFQWDLQAQ